MPLQLAIVLHAHLPYVAEATAFHPCERWLHEAIWECYLPLLRMLEEQAIKLRPGAARPLITLSISETLAAMLQSAPLQHRFEEHLAALRDLHRRHGRDLPVAAGPAHAHYQRLLDRAADDWQACNGDVYAAFARLAERNGIELITTAASHAFLPGLAPLAGAAATQLGLGLHCFQQRSGQRVGGVWLPELGFHPRLDATLHNLGVRHTVVAEHALDERDGSARQAGVRYLARDHEATAKVWSRRHGYPGHPHYRDFYADLGRELAEERLTPFEAGGFTGLKYRRIEALGSTKLPYEPDRAELQVQRDARDFVDGLARRQRADGTRCVLTAFDAELFGHWWHEGVAFLRAVLNLVASHPDVATTSLSGYRCEQPARRIAMPRQSSWGRGGHALSWIGPRSARWWRHIHAAYEHVRRTTQRHASLTGDRGRALDQAIREVLLLQASDWLYQLNHSGDHYAEQRLRQHHRAALRHAAVANAVPAPLGTRSQGPAEEWSAAFLSPLQSHELRAALLEPPPKPELAYTGAG